MKLEHLLYTIIFSSILLLQSCNVDNTGLEPPVTGKNGELVLVIEKNMWESTPGDLFKDMFSGEMDALPQPEPLFDLVNTPSKAFSKIIKTHRNIIITKVSQKVSKTGIIVKEDVWAKPQTVVQINAKTKDELVQLTQDNRDKLVQIFLQADMDRRMSWNRKYQDIEIYERIKKHHHITLTAPKGYNLAADSLNFVWLRHRRPGVDQGILLYYYNYTDTSQFHLGNLIYKRDSVLRRMVPGQKHGSYMGTETDVPFVYREAMLNNNYSVEIRGLWKIMEDCCMGGPFVSISMVDTLRSRIITAEGFVYGPGHDKREYISEVEGIIRSVGFSGKDE